MPLLTTPGVPPPLVGRDRELMTLRAALDAALAGRGSLVLVGGEAGIGKTALAEATLAEAANRGAAVLVGRCYDLSETPPYGPWAEALARAPAGDGLPAPPDFAGGGGSGSQVALFAQVRDHLTGLATRRPLVLVLEDLHWADPASLDLLRAVARRPDDVPLLLLATYRVDELTRRHPLYRLLPTLVREARATRLDLRPLTDAGLAALVGARYPLTNAAAGRLVAYLRAHAEGNPFYIGELLHALDETGILRLSEGQWTLGNLAGLRLPPLLRQVLDARLDRLGDAARAVLATAAVLGQAVPLDLWQAVSGADEATLTEIIERASAARLVEETPEGLGVRFAHALVREALYEATPALRRRRLHRRAGEVLLASPHPDPDAVAHHLQRAGDDRAAEWLLRAGERARRAHAWLTAAERYEAALALLEPAGAAPGRRAELLIALAHLRRYADAKHGVTYLEEAERLAAEAGDETLAACACFDQGQLRTQAGEFRRGLAEMAALLPVLEGLPPVERARLPTLRVLGVGPAEPHHRGVLVIHLANVGRLAEAAALGAPLPARGPGATGRGLVGLGQVHAYRGQPEEARCAYAAARATFRATAQVVEVYRAFAYEFVTVVLPYLADQPALWEPLAAEAEAVAALASLASPDLVLSWAACPLLLLRGAWDEARHIAPLHWLPCFAGQLARYRGDVLAARAVVRRCLPQGPATEPGDTYLALALPSQQLAAALALDAGDLPLARSWLAAHDRWLAWSGSVLYRAEGHLGWAAYHRAAGDPAAAREHAARALACAIDPRQPVALLAARRLLGEVDTAEGDFVAARAHLTEALALADACAAPYERALTLLAMTELRHAEGHHAAARAVLDEARATFDHLGARPTLARCAALAARLPGEAGTGVAIPAPAVTAAPYPARLTAREVEVLRLIAAGLSNREMAEALCRSERTVERHIENIYRKIDAHSKADATAFAFRHRLA